jgi:hypothetical protein
VWNYFTGASSVVVVFYYFSLSEFKNVSAFQHLILQFPCPVKCAWPVESAAACEVPGYFTGLFQRASDYFTGDWPVKSVFDTSPGSFSDF